MKNKIKKFLFALLVLGVITSCAPSSPSIAQAAVCQTYPAPNVVGKGGSVTADREGGGIEPNPSLALLTQRIREHGNTEGKLPSGQIDIVYVGGTNASAGWIVADFGCFRSGAGADAWEWEFGDNEGGEIWFGSVGATLPTSPNSTGVPGPTGWTHVPATVPPHINTSCDGTQTIPLSTQGCASGSQGNYVDVGGADAQYQYIYFWKKGGNNQVNPAAEVDELDITHPSSNQPPVGYCDGVTGTNLLGWTYDPDNSPASIGVHFYIDGPVGQGTGFAGTIANIPRSDVNQTMGVTGDHGYSFSIPTQFRNGQDHTIHAYGIDTDGGANPLLGNCPKTFNIPPVTPPPPATTRECTLSSATPPGYAGRILVDFTDKFWPTSAWMGAKSNEPHVQAFQNVSIPAGNYRVTLEGLDDHTQQHACYLSGNCTIDMWQQFGERYYLAIQNSAGTLMARTADTPDIGDFEDRRTDVVNTTLAVPTDVARVQPVHSAPVPDGNSQSLVASCAAFDRIIPPNSASCQGITAPTSVTAGQTFAATVRVKNTGSASWTVTGNPSSYRLGSTQANNNTRFGPAAAELPSEPIVPGQTATFAWNAVAPTNPAGTAGCTLVSGTTYRCPFSWQMKQANVGFFTDGQCSQDIIVGPSVPPPVMTLSAAAHGGLGKADTNFFATEALASGSVHIPYNTKADLTWNSDNTSTCVTAAGSPSWPNQVVPPDGTWGPSENLTRTTTYSATCHGMNGSDVTDSVTVIVDPPAPTLTFNANPTSITSGQTTVLTWSSTNMRSCSATGGVTPWAGSKATSGTETSAPLTQTTTFAISCIGNDDSVTNRQVTVTVGSASFGVNLQVNAGSGFAESATGAIPLEGVSLKAILSGSATGPVTYTFSCGNNTSPFTVTDPGTGAYVWQGGCYYRTEGNFTPSVTAVRGSLTAQDSATITAAQACQITQVPPGRSFASFTPTFSLFDLSLSGIIESIIAVLPSRQASSL